MAKKRRSRKPVIPLRIDHQVAVLAPISGAITLTILADTAINRLFLLSIKAVYALRDNTPGDGPLYLGVAHSDYSATEVLEWYNAQGNWDQGDLIVKEQARRRIRRVGIFNGNLANENLNNGVEISTKLGFIVEEGDSLSYFTVNEGGATRSTGGVAEMHGTCWAKNA